MKQPFRTLLVILSMVVAGIALAQTTSVQELNEQMDTLSSFENAALLERDQLRRNLDDPDTVVFYYPESGRWITMPRERAVELADRLIVMAELNPAILDRLRNRLGMRWFLVELALSQPGLAAEQLVALVEARQRPQLEAVLADYDALVGELQTLFAEVRAQRDALLDPDVATATLPSFEGRWRIEGIDEVVEITQTGNRIEAVKTVGNSNVPAGELNFWADLSTLEGEGQQASRGFSNPRMVSVKMTIIDEDTFEVNWQNGSYIGIYIRQSP